MPLDLPAGISCFVDSNIFVYHFAGVGPITACCREFLCRIGGSLTGFTTASCIADAVHRFMMIEAQEKFALGMNTLRWLQRHPERIRELTIYQDAAREVEVLPLQLLVPDAVTISEATDISHTHSLLTNDAIIVALMRRHGLTHVVTNDDDFDRVPGLTVWKPR